MRNQCWNQQGRIVEDTELYRDAGVAKLKDWLTGTVRNATAEEETVLSAHEKFIGQQEARGRAMAAIKANATQSPWGRILFDLAVAQGWILE